MRVHGIVRSTCVFLLGTLIVSGCSSSSSSPSEASSRPSSAENSDAPSGGATSPAESDQLLFRRVVVARSADAKAPLPVRGKVAERFGETDCASAQTDSSPKRSVVACDDSGFKYLLEPAAVVNGLRSVSAREFKGHWLVVVIVDDKAQEDFRDLAKKLADDDSRRVAFELHGLVVGSGTLNQLAEKGRTTIASASKAAAQELADTLSRLAD